MRLKLYKKKITIIILIILFIIYIINLLNFSLGSDEQFTIGLVHNTYVNIIRLDTLDVHPPLYYLLLKIFLQITTFWTSNIIIKILFARIFSSIIALICIYFGIKTLQLTKNNVKQFIIPLCIIFVLMPSVFLYSQFIRMYILAAMFLFIELYELIKYIKYHKDLNLILSIIIASLAAYTHYFAAISAGLFIFYFFINSLIKKKYKESIKLMISGIIYFILYIPWMVIAQKQFSMATSNQYNTNQIYTKSTYTSTNFINLVKNTLLSFVGGQSVYGLKAIKYISLVLLLLFIYFIYWSLKNLSHSFNSLLCTSGMNLLGTIIIGLTVSLIKHPILIDHYLFPSFSIFAFFMSYLIYKYIKQAYYCNRSYICILLLLVFTLFMNITLYTRQSVKNLSQSQAIITKINKWEQSDHRNIYIKNNKVTIWNIADDSIYLRPIHKDVLTNNFKNTNQMFGKPNVKLMHGIYPNVVKKN